MHLQVNTTNLVLHSFRQNIFKDVPSIKVRLPIQIIQKRWYLEPSVTFNNGSVKANFPADFAAIEDSVPNYFLFEPGLHFGLRF